MDTEFYRDKLVISDHLDTDTYRRVPPNADKTVYRDLTKLVDKHKGCLTTKEREYIAKDDWKSSNFYVLPNIHKSKQIAENFA